MKKIFAIVLSLNLIMSPVAVAKSGGGGMLKQILGMANGVVGATIITQCKLAAMQPSLMVYMAGSLVFVASEILGGKGQKKKQTEQADKLNEVKSTMKEGGDFQKAAIEAQLEDEKGTLKHIQGRRKWMMATKVIYTAATALAAIEVFKSFTGLDNAACVPNPAATKPITKAISLAYSGLSGYAGGGIMGAAMAGGAAAFGASTLAKFVLKFETAAEGASNAVGVLSSAIGRIAFFGAATVLVVMIDAELKKEENESKKKIADLEKVLNQFNKDTGAGTQIAEGPSTSGGAGSGNVDPKSKTYAVKALPTWGDLPKHCYTSSGGIVNYSEECKNPIKLNSPKFDGSMNLPTLQAVANLATDMGNAVANGDSARADAAAGELASMAGRMDAVRDDLMKKANAKLIAEGKKPIDINGQLQSQIDGLNAALNRGNPGSGNYSLADLEKDDSGPGDVPVENFEIKTASAPAQVSIPSPDLSKFSEGEYNDEMTERTTPTLSESLEDYELNESDIAKRDGVSIFEQVSNRYLLNYTKIFSRKEIPTVEETKAPKQ